MLCDLFFFARLCYAIFNPRKIHIYLYIINSLLIAIYYVYRGFFFCFFILFLYMNINNVLIKVLILLTKGKRVLVGAINKVKPSSKSLNLFI